MSADLWDRVEDAYDNLTDLRRVCRSCGNLSRNLEDAECPRCLGGEPHSASRDIRPSIARGHANTARLLRSIGYAEEALWHEERARR